MKQLTRIMGILLACLLLFAGIPNVLAGEEANLVLNGTFEELDEEGYAVDWTPSHSKPWGEFASIAEENGNHYVSVGSMTGTRHPFVSYKLPVYEMDAAYTISFRFKCENEGVAIGPKVTIEQKGSSSKEYYKTEAFDVKNFGSADKGVWKTYSTTFSVAAHEKLKQVVVLLCGDGTAKADYCYDDVKVVCDKPIDLTPVLEARKPIEYPYYQPLPGAENLLQNGGFEGESAKTLWEPSKNADGKNAWENNAYVSIATDKKHGGEASVKLSYDGTTLSWVRQMVPVEPGATYQISSWIRPDYNKAQKGYIIMYEFYNENRMAGETMVGGSCHSDYFQYRMPRTWTQIHNTIQAPPDATWATIYFRLYGRGELYVDDVEMYKIAETPRMTMETDDIFYYTENEKITVTASYNVLRKDDCGGLFVQFSLLDGETVLSESERLAFADKTKHTFPLSLLKEKGKKYTVKTTLYDAAGNELETETESAYKYDRPGYLRADGIFEKNGVEIVPVIGYGINWFGDTTDADCADAHEIGVNVVMGGTSIDVNQMQERLDTAARNGQMMILGLYQNMLPSGHPLRESVTKAAVEKFKDHPALFGYGIMDEPFAGKTIHDMKGWLENAYKIIRDIDPNHPVYLCECPEYTKDINRENSWRYAYAAKYVDCFAVDPYPAGKHPQEEFVAEEVDAAQEAVSGKKPVYSILQAFEWKGYEPTDDDLRNGLYQAYLSGISGLGYYSLGSSIAGAPMKETHYWKTLSDFAKLEQKDFEDAFIKAKHPIFNRYETETYRGAAFVKDNALYVAVASRNAEDAVQVEIPLSSFDGTIQVGNYKATVINGAAANTFAGNGTLSVTLEKAQAVLYRLECENADFAGLAAARFIDLEPYPWAATQIERMREQGVAYGKTFKNFAPGEKITRADFAVFLIRALGLTAEGGEGFKDVPEDAYFAKELTIGKQLGILNGVGDNLYNPYAEISRQDLMTICARGMRLVGTLSPGGNLADFSDGTVVADYAKDSVASMVATGIIRGNADGTINPMGNTTRAEAAVIMDRIVGWK